MDGVELIHDWNKVDCTTREGPGPVLLNDETLRDGLQSPTVQDPTIEEKVRLLHLMEALGIQSADIGLPGAGPRAYQDVLALATEISKSKLKIYPNCAARTVINDDNRELSHPISLKDLVSPDLSGSNDTDDSNLVVGYLDWIDINLNLPPSDSNTLTQEQDIASEFKRAFTEPNAEPYLVLPDRITGPSVYLYAQPIPRDQPMSRSGVSGPTGA